MTELPLPQRPFVLARRSLLGAFGALLLAGCASLGALGARDVPLRVMSWNIQYGGGGRNLDAIAAAIRATGADIVALQEVDVHWSDRSGFADQAATLAAALGMEVRFAPIYHIPDATGARPPRQFGLALLSRHPIVRFTNHPMTRLSTQEADATPRPQPGFLEAVVNVNGAAVRVFDAHLDYRADPAVRRQQVAEMLALLDDSALPTVLLGDLNARPDAPELGPLFARLRDAGPAPTVNTFPAHAPDRRIDYVLVSPEIRVRGAHVPPVTASDHRPVVVGLTVQAR